MVQQPNIPKKKHTKTKTGCMTCRKRRIKCDEAKPSCNHCLKKSLSCHYMTTFKATCYVADGVKLVSTKSYEENRSIQIQSYDTTDYDLTESNQRRQNQLRAQHDLTKMHDLKKKVDRLHLLYESQLSTYVLTETFSESDIEMFYQIFKGCTSQILSISSIPERNPWLALVWPLALKQSVLLEAIVSMIFFHFAGNHNLTIKNMGTTCFRRSIAHLSELISDSVYMENNSIVVFITCLVLARAEVWLKSTSCGIPHLRGAKSCLLNIVKRYESSITNYDLEELELFVFGYRTFLYMGDMARTNSFSLTDLVKEELYTESIFDNPIIKDLETRSYINNPIDPISGYFTKVFISIGRVGTFIQRQIVKTNKCNYKIITAALELRKELECCEPDLEFLGLSIDDDDPLCDFESCVKMANCYRLSSLYYLHQAVPDIASKPDEFFVKAIMKILKSIPIESKVHLISISPLFYAACGACDKEDRIWFEQRLRFLFDIIRVENMKKVEEVVKECWRRRDALKLYAPHLNGLYNDDLDISSPDGSIRSVTHWTSVMDDFGWEVMRC